MIISSFIQLTENVKTMTSKQITIKDIAHELGLHHSTVSRALRHDPRVNDATKKRVHECAQKHHYQPNTIAINLRDARSKTIGVVVPSIHHYYFSQIISAIINQASKTGYSVIISQSNESVEIERQNILALIQSRVAGVIASVSRETKNSDHFAMLLNKNIPLVFFDRVCNDLNAPKVLVKNKQAAQIAVRHLVNAGYNRIAYLGGFLATNVFNDRLQGYRSELEKHQLPVREDWMVFNDFDFKAGQTGMRQILSRPEKPNAVLCVSFELAMGALDEIWNHSMKVPEDIAIVTFGEEPMSKIVRPGITTVAQPREQIAEEAFNMLCQQLKNEPQNTPQIRWLETELIIRGSSRERM